MKLHDLGYRLRVVDADGEEFHYDDAIDMGLTEDGDTLRVETEHHSHLLFEPLPQEVTLLQEDVER